MTTVQPGDTYAFASTTPGRAPCHIDIVDITVEGLVYLDITSLSASSLGVSTRSSNMHIERVVALIESGNWALRLVDKPHD